MFLPFDLVISLLGIHLKEMKEGKFYKDQHSSGTPNNENWQKGYKADYSYSWQKRMCISTFAKMDR